MKETVKEFSDKLKLKENPKVRAQNFKVWNVHDKEENEKGTFGEIEEAIKTS